MKKFLLSLISVSSAIAGCSSNNTPQHLTPTQQVVRQPDPVVIVNNNAPADNFKLLYGSDPALQAAFKQFSKTGKAPNIKTTGFERFAYMPEQQPIINCEPFQETIIALEPGERFTSITSGDPKNLSYMVAVAGAATGVEIQHVLVKPAAPKMSTNLVIVTDKRVYNILIVVGARGEVTRNVSFWYPQQMLASVNNSIDKKNDIAMNAEKMPQLNLANANFNYKLDYDSWSKPSWYPVRVFDDGKRTWIELPQGTDSKNIPTVLIQTDSGQDTKYQQSYYSPYILIEGVFGQAKLISGVGGDQVQVDIINKNYTK
jgi:type IV secretion system protein VirB9